MSEVPMFIGQRPENRVVKPTVFPGRPLGPKGVPTKP